MTGARRLLVKLAAALLVGVPITLIPAFFLAWGFFAGIEGLFAPPKVRAVQAGALTLMWSLAGILGILGFWAWIFLARNARQEGITDIERQNDRIWLLTPEAGVEVWFGKNVRIALSAGYRIAGDVQLSAFDRQALQSLVNTLTIKVGNFGKSR